MSKAIIINGKKYLVGKHSEQPYKKDYAYAFKKKNGSKFYLIYRGELSSLDEFKKQNKKGFYFIKNENCIKKILTDKNNSSDNLLDLPLNDLINKLNQSKKDDITPKDEGYMSSDESLFRPPILPTDSELIVLVKRILNQENWSSKDLSKKIDNSIELSNIKRSLTKHSTISFERFQKWMYLLDKEYEIIIKNKADK